MNDFRSRRRQIFLEEVPYRTTVRFLQKVLPELIASKTECRDQAALASLYRGVTELLWKIWSLRYTAGEPLHALAAELEPVVAAYERYVEAYEDTPNSEYYDPVRLCARELRDTYVDYVNLLSSAILLHREDLVPRIFGLIEGGNYDGSDLVIEQLLKPYLPGRPEIDEWLWDKPYRIALDAVVEDTAQKREKGMRAFVKAWYPSMKGCTGFWNLHAHELRNGMNGYRGYWTMEAAALSYLYGIDDASYRDELAYPKDLADYAHAQPQRTPEAARQALRGGTPPAPMTAGQTCPRSGWWSTPAQRSSRRYFLLGDVLPGVEIAGINGHTTWQWETDQSQDPALTAHSGLSAPRAGLWRLQDDADVRCRVQLDEPLPLHQGQIVRWVWLDESVGVYARSGQSCPSAGRWRCQEVPQVERTFADGATLPELDGRAVTWRLYEAM